MSNTHYRPLPSSGLALKLFSAAAAGALVILCGAPARAQFGAFPYLTTDKSGLVLAPAERVSDDTMSLTWSPDSVRLLTFNVRHINNTLNLADISRDPGPPESDLSIGRWNRKSHNADIVWKRRFVTEPSLFGDPIWIPHTQSVAQVVFWQARESETDEKGEAHTHYTPCQELLWIDAARSTVHELEMKQGDELSVSPTRSIAVIICRTGVYDNHPAQLTPVRLDGSVGTPVQLPLRQGINGTLWSKDGSSLLLTVVGLRDGSKQLTTSYVSYNPSTGEMAPTEAPKPDATQIPVPNTHEIVIKQTTQHVKYGSADALIHPLWAETAVKSDKSAMLVAADADRAQISPDGAAVAYRSQRSSWISEVVAVPLAEFKAMIARAQRAVAMSNAKQLGLAVIMWAMDHDDTLPGPDDINSQLTPYLLNDNLFDQFNYTFAGGPLAGIESPAETILGTVDGPSGQAIIFSDGHVKWRAR